MTIGALADRGPSGRVAALALATTTGLDADAEALTTAILHDVRTTHSSAAASALLSLDLPVTAAAAAAELISASDPATPTAHVGEAMKVLWSVGGPGAVPPIRQVAEPAPGIPREWRDHYLQKQAVHYLSLVEPGVVAPSSDPGLPNAQPVGRPRLEPVVAHALVALASALTVQRGDVRPATAWWGVRAAA